MAIFWDRFYWPYSVHCMDTSPSVRLKSHTFMFPLNSCLYNDFCSVAWVWYLILPSFVKSERRSAFRLPWNQHTIRGWIGETVFSVISSSLYLFTNVVFLTFFIGICEFHRAFLHYFNVLVITVDNTKDTSDSDIETMLCNIIEFHVAIKRFVWNCWFSLFEWRRCAHMSEKAFSICRYFRKTAHVFSLILLTQLVFVVLHMTCSVFQMDMVSQRHRSVVLILLKHFAH